MRYERRYVLVVMSTMPMLLTRDYSSDTPDSSHPGLLERNKTIPTSSFSIFSGPKELEKKKQPLPSSRLLPCSCLSRLTHLVHDQPTGNENSSPLLSSPSGSMPPTTAEVPH